jgi:hypothetical protein
MVHFHHEIRPVTPSILPCVTSNEGGTTRQVPECQLSIVAGLPLERITVSAQCRREGGFASATP